MTKTLSKTAIILLVLFAGAIPFINFVEANPAPANQVPPIVSMPELQYNAKISQVNGKYMATVDTIYKMSTVHAYGDTFPTANQGMGLIIDSSPTVKVSVVYNSLDTYYPVPLNTAEFSAKIDNTTLNWTPANRTFHLFGANLQELKWNITPVPGNFQISTHYKQPIQTTTDLGKYALVIPFGQRFGLDEINYYYNQYPWFGSSSTAKLTIQSDIELANIQAYSIDGFGKLKQLNYTLNANGKAQTIEFSTNGENPSDYNTSSPFGAVLIFDDAPQSSIAPQLTFTITVVACIIVLAVGVLLFSRKKRRWTNSNIPRGAPKKTTVSTILIYNLTNIILH